MLKKSLLILALLIFISGGIFALPKFTVSAGIGTYFTSDFGGGLEFQYDKPPYGAVKFSITESYFGGGGFLFLDVTYIEISAGFFYVPGKMNIKSYEEGIGIDFQGFGIDSSIFLKYPFIINDRAAVFPLLGICYRAFISTEVKTEGSDTESRLMESIFDGLNVIWFKAGAGFDYSFGGSVFLRAEFLYGIRYLNGFESDILDYFKMMGTVGEKTLPGHGLEVKLAIGFRL